jgi:hypothetical protein
MKLITLLVNDPFVSVFKFFSLIFHYIESGASDKSHLKQVLIRRTGNFPSSSSTELRPGITSSSIPAHKSNNGV